ncbi:hypothetical protein GQX73_g16 [Xylaria multiplex]|uniref:Arp2/3 complex 34 kDa subunit n=1 Tax=Xylaria multiplex TaxID=323545 RepID=A0A7C8IVP4_9PEZI|nr:hypothetical protein GQX73_g16 [Xylaria multiplex]
MLLLDYQNVLIQSVLTERFSGAPPAHIDQTVSDFDGVTFHISTPETKTQILVSLQIRCFKELVQYGAQDVLQREYGQYVVPPETGYDFSVLVDLENLPADKEERDELIHKISLLKRNAMAAPFEHAYSEHYKLKEAASKYTSEEAPQGVREGGDVMAIHYRDEEAIYVKASHDRVTVIFSTIFREETDRVFGKVFIQEFVDARRRAIQNAPQVLFRNDPPLELQGVPGATIYSPDKNAADLDSLVPPTFNPPAHARRYFPHPNLQGLFPLSHQSIKGIYSLSYEKEDGRLSTSPAPSQTRERREGKEDSERKNIQGSGRLEGPINGS